MTFSTLFIVAALVSVASAATFSNMLLVILENTNYQSAIADPNLKAFADSGVLFSNWTATTHPSQPNYIAMTSGATNGVTSDSSITINVQNIADLFEAKGLTWKSYQENWPGNCFTGLCLRTAYITGSITHSLATRIFNRIRRVVLVSSGLLSLTLISLKEHSRHFLGTRLTLEMTAMTPVSLLLGTGSTVSLVRLAPRLTLTSSL